MRDGSVNPAAMLTDNSARFAASAILSGIIIGSIIITPSIAGDGL